MFAFELIFATSFFSSVNPALMWSLISEYSSDFALGSV